ncbi:MAG: hypothetical protein ACLQNE_46495 [Thermoguttaceae bacterium]
MFEWLRRILRQSDDDERQRFFAMIDSLNAKAAGGNPKRTKHKLGKLAIRSRTLVLGDPLCLPYLEIPNFSADEVSISARLWQYPSGAVIVTKLTIYTAGEVRMDSHRKIGAVGIDGARIVVADKADIHEYWTETGKDRIVSFARLATTLCFGNSGSDFTSRRFKPIAFVLKSSGLFLTSSNRKLRLI